MTQAILGRRHFLQGGLGLAGLAALAGCGLTGVPMQQPAKIPRVGILCAACGPDVTTARMTPNTLNGAFLEGMRELGYVEGQNVVYEVRGGDGRDDLLPRLAAELVHLPVDLIATTGANQAPLAAKQATETIPIVFMAVGDPIEAGLVANLTRPGGNLTGTTGTSPRTVGKRFEVFKEVVPSLRSIDIVANASGSPGFSLLWREAESAAQRLGLRVRLRDAHDPVGLREAFTALAADRPDGLYVEQDTALSRHQALIVELVGTARLPAMYSQRRALDDGGLMSYGADLRESFKSAAPMVDKILKGARPGDQPIQSPTRFNFAIHLKAAEAIGLTIPSSVLAQATELIQ